MTYFHQLFRTIDGVLMTGNFPNVSSVIIHFLRSEPNQIFWAAQYVVNVPCIFVIHITSPLFHTFPHSLSSFSSCSSANISQHIQIGPLDQVQRFKLFGLPCNQTRYRISFCRRNMISPDHFYTSNCLSRFNIATAWYNFVAKVLWKQSLW